MKFVNRTSILLVVLMSFLFSVIGESSGEGKSFNGYGSPYEMLSAANYSEATTPGRRLLMPVWAYKSAAGYLLFVSVMGLALNMIVALVLLSDQQVGFNLIWFFSRISLQLLLMEFDRKWRRWIGCYSIWLAPMELARVLGIFILFRCRKWICFITMSNF